MKSADQKHCFSCGEILHISSTSCPKCGAAQPQMNLPSPHQLTARNEDSVVPVGQQAFCRGCGSVIHLSAVTCPKCGAPQRANPQASSLNFQGSTRNKTTAGILGILLGGIGAHKFYLGRIWLGLLYLIFVWTFIPAIVGFFEGVYYLTLSDEEFDRKFT